MSTYYLVDMHAADLADGRIVDVVTTQGAGAEFRVDGLVPIRVPDGVHIDNPADLTDLLAQKYTGILARYPGFAQIVYDDLLDADDVVAIGMAKLGARGMIGGYVAIGPVTLATSASQCILVYEHYTWKHTVNPTNGRIERFYVEEPEGDSPARLSLNAGVDFTETTSGALVVVNPGEEGNNLRVQFLQNGAVSQDQRLIHTGSWSVIY